MRTVANVDTEQYPTDKGCCAYLVPKLSTQISATTNDINSYYQDLGPILAFAATSDPRELILPLVRGRTEHSLMPILLSMVDEFPEDEFEFAISLDATTEMRVLVR